MYFEGSGKFFVTNKITTTKNEDLSSSFQHSSLEVLIDIEILDNEENLDLGEIIM